jgi:hypothetical protein
MQSTVHSRLIILVRAAYSMRWLSRISQLSEQKIHHCKGSCPTVSQFLQSHNNTQIFPEELEIYWCIWVSVLVHTVCICVCVWLDNATSRKGLDVHQAAYANKKYKSHRKVSLLSDIIASLATEDELESS